MLTLASNAELVKAFAPLAHLLRVNHFKCKTASLVEAVYVLYKENIC